MKELLRLSKSFNPYFIGLPILIMNLELEFAPEEFKGFNPYFIGLPILILTFLRYLPTLRSFNPYFIGLPILILTSNFIFIIFLLVSILILLDYLFL